MFEYIESLRNKPDHKKKQIAFVTSASLTFIIFAFWLVSLEANSVNRQMAAEKGKALVSPFKAVTANVANIFESIADSKEAVKKAVSGTTNVQVEVVPGRVK